MIITLTPNEGNVLLEELKLKNDRDLENFKQKLFRDASKFVTLEHLEDGSVYFYIEEVFAMTLINTMKPKFKYFVNLNKSTIGLVKVAMDILKDVKKDYRDVIDLASVLMREQQREDGAYDDEDALDNFYEDDDDDDDIEPSASSNTDNVINMPTSIHEVEDESESNSNENASTPIDQVVVDGDVTDAQDTSNNVTMETEDNLDHE